MKKLTLVLAGAALLLLPSLAFAQSAQVKETTATAATTTAVSTEPDVIEVTGYGTREVAPDSATLTFTFEAKADTTKKGIAKNKTAIEKVKTALAAAGITDLQVTSSAANVYSETVYDAYDADVTKPQTTVKSFSLTQGFRIASKKSDTFLDLVDMIAASGVNDLSGVYPDLGEISFSLTADGKTAKDARAKNEEVLNKVKAVMLDFGLSVKKNLETTSYSLYPSYTDSDSQDDVRFVVSHSVTVTTKDLEKVSEITDILFTEGATRLDQTEYKLSDYKSIFKELRKEAYADAREKAEDIATITGMKLGRVGNVYDSSYTPSSYVSYGGCCGSSSGSGMIRVEVTLIVEFRNYNVKR